MPAQQQYNPRHHTIRIARAERAGDAVGAQDARRDYAAAKLEDAIRTTLEAAPPLTNEQRQRLRTLLAPEAHA